MSSLQICSIVDWSATPGSSQCRRYAAGFLASMFAALFVCSTAFAAPAVTVTNARIRLLPGDLPMSGYFDLVNRDKQPLTLTSVSSPDFKMVHMHRSI